MFYTINWQNENKKLLYSDFLEKYLRDTQQNVNENNTSSQKAGVEVSFIFCGGTCGYPCVHVPRMSIDVRGQLGALAFWHLPPFEKGIFTRLTQFARTGLSSFVMLLLGLQVYSYPKLLTRFLSNTNSCSNACEAGSLFP